MLEQRVVFVEKLGGEIEDAQVLLELGASENDEATLDEVEASLPAIEAKVRQAELARMLSGPVDHSSAILAIHPGSGGEEAKDWAKMLLRMYQRWCERRGFKVEMLDFQPGDNAGIDGATLSVQGENAFGYLRAENGVHRLVRISPFDANARRHTSFTAVEVTPDIEDEIDITIKDEDLETTTMRASGAGGQKVNKTESAVRMKHIPSGIVVVCRVERSQHQNRAMALKMLKAKLYEAEIKRQEEANNAYQATKSLNAWGSQIRSYVLAPYRLVKDVRTGHHTGNVDAVLDGELDDFIEAYLLAASGGTLRKGGAIEDEAD